MTNAELLAKIKAEIERRITDNTFGAKLELIDILAWLDTLESEKPVPNDLEEVAWDCVLDSVDVNNPVLLPKYKELLTSLFIDGAKWQYEQMMEEAVEGYVVKDITGSLAVTAKGINLDGFKFGDKVRIIIVKEEE